MSTKRAPWKERWAAKKAQKAKFKSKPIPTGEGILGQTGNKYTYSSLTSDRLRAMLLDMITSTLTQPDKQTKQDGKPNNT